MDRFMIVSLPPSLSPFDQTNRTSAGQTRKEGPLAETERPTNRPGVSSPLAASRGTSAMLRIHAIPLEEDKEEQRKVAR